jgi:putative protease
VVLARELSLEQIREIYHTLHSTHYTLHPDEVATIELEAFVHGALCVSYSGRCYLSEVLMDRSANRGCCAQLCRQRYDLLNKDGNEIVDIHGEPIHQRYLLSLQDMDRSLHLAELIEAGVTTFKIEGRLKDRDYVTNIVAYYRQLLDQLIANTPALEHASTRSVYQYSFTPNPAKTFHRGQTDYFLHGRTPNMANWETPKSTGEKIGKVIATRHNAICVELAHGITLHNGDGICYGDRGFAINRIDGDWIYPNNQYPIPNSPQGVQYPKVGTTLYRNLDNEFLRSLRAERRMPVDIRFEAVDDGFRLTIGAFSSFFAAEQQPANNPQRALQTIMQQLNKLGDTDFIAQSIHVLDHGQICSDTFPYFIPTSLLNQWRREVSNRKSALQRNNLQRSELQRSDLQAKPIYSEASQQPLMTCKYCILYELGHCRKINPMTNEPRYLRLQNGTLLSLEFDCKQCEMKINRK